MKENSRRRFLIKAGKGSVLLAGGAIALSGCNDSSAQAPELTRGKSKKKEILYQKSKFWEAYYSITN